MWPPASMPWAMMKSQPAFSAAIASATEPTCQEASAPPSCTRRTSSGSGSPQKKSITFALGTAISRIFLSR